MTIDTARIPQGKSGRGFTLVELLVSITMIIVLAALVFAVTGKIRASVQHSNLVSAIRQIGFANVGYYTENNGSINVIRDSTEKGSYEGTGGKWVGDSFMGRMQPYLFSGIVTSDQKKLAAAITTSLCELLGTTDHPSGVLYMTFGRYYFNAQLCEKYMPLPTMGDNRRAIYFLPTRKGIFCFLDGHVEMLSAPIEELRLGVRPPDP